MNKIHSLTLGIKFTKKSKILIKNIIRNFMPKEGFYSWFYSRVELQYHAGFLTSKAKEPIHKAGNQFKVFFCEGNYFVNPFLPGPRVCTFGYIFVTFSRNGLNRENNPLCGKMKPAF